MEVEKTFVNLVLEVPELIITMLTNLLMLLRVDFINLKVVLDYITVKI